jgi:hypothetical protein
VIDMDDDALVAGVALVGRTGATGVEIGYVKEGVPVAEADWYAEAQYRGARMFVEHHAGPVEAVEALARKLMSGARCVHCGGLVALSDRGAMAHPGLMGDGKVWTLDEIRAAGQCRYTRMGREWVRGCAGDRPRERPGARGRRPKAKPKRKR